MRYGITRVSPSMIAQEQRITALPSDPQETLLARYLVQLTQQNKVGTPEYYLAAGEFQNRQKMRQEQAAKQQQMPPVAQQINQQAMATAMEDRGVAALPVGGIGEIGNYTGATGGIVAFDDGGEVQRFQGQGPSFVQSARTSGLGVVGAGMPDPRRNLFQFTPEEEEEQRRLREMSLPEKLRYLASKGIDKILAMEPRRLQDIVAKQPATVALLAAGPTTQPAPAAGGPGITQTPLSQQQAPSTTPQMGISTLGPLNFTDIARQAQQASLELIGPARTTRPEVPTNIEAVRDVRDTFKAAGFNFDLFKDQIKELEKQKEQFSLDRKDAANLRILEAGLGILGGESPYAFVNIGKGASPALKGFTEDVKELKKLERDRQKNIRDIQIAENQIAAGVGEKAQTRLDEAQKRQDKFDSDERSIKASMATTMITALNSRDVANLNAKVTSSRNALQDTYENRQRALAATEREMSAEIRSNPLAAQKFQDRALYEQEFNNRFLRNLQLIEKGQLSDKTANDPVAAARAEMEKRGLK